MLQKKVPWDIWIVVTVHGLRILIGWLILRVVFPWIGINQPTLIEITDRLVIIFLVWTLVRRHRDQFAAFGLVSASWRRDILTGLIAGGGLLMISMYSERLYTSLSITVPSQHPLVARVEEATSWQGLVVPLLLAGVMAPVVEELLYRMVTFTALRDRWGIWGGAIGSAALFAILHFNGYWLAELMIAGIGFALLYQYTGSLWSSIVAHSFVNTAKIIMLFIGVPLV